MAQTLYASFADASLAEKAAGALLDYGVLQEDISLVANNERGQAQRTEGSNLDATGAAPATAAGVGRGAGNVGDRAIDDTKSIGHSVAQAGDRVAGAVTGAVGADNASANFHAAADQHAVGADARAAMAGNEPAVHGSAAQADAGYVTGTDLNADRTVYTTGGGTGGTVATDAQDDTAMSAKHGLSTTTPQDAGAGAVKGAGIGLVLGAIAAFAVPGVGWAIGGGALASALGATALAAGAGAIAGGVTGYLKDQGVPGEAAERYHGTIENGGALLAIHVPSGKVDQAEASQIIAKYGGGDVSTY